jgi:hypothetical protein
VVDFAVDTGYNNSMGSAYQFNTIALVINPIAISRSRNS